MATSPPSSNARCAAEAPTGGAVRRGIAPAYGEDARGPLARRRRRHGEGDPATDDPRRDPGETYLEDPGSTEDRNDASYRDPTVATVLHEHSERRRSGARDPRRAEGDPPGLALIFDEIRRATWSAIVCASTTRRRARFCRPAISPQQFLAAVALEKDYAERNSVASGCTTSLRGMINGVRFADEPLHGSSRRSPRPRLHGTRLADYFGDRTRSCSFFSSARHFSPNGGEGLSRRRPVLERDLPVARHPTGTLRRS
jgi:hypothetical protein